MCAVNVCRHSLYLARLSEAFYLSHMGFCFFSVQYHLFTNDSLVQKKKKKIFVQHCCLEQIIGTHNLIHG